MRSGVRRDGEPNRRERHAFEGLALAVAAMLLCFFASTAYTALRMRELTGHSEVVSENALPGVLQLTRVRREVRRVERELDDVVEGRSPWTPDVVDGAFDRLDAAITAYRGTEDFAGEAEAWARASAALGGLRSAVEGLATHLSTYGADAASSRIFEAQVGPWTDEVDEHLTQLIDLNARGGQEAAARVEATRARIVRRALGLDVVSLVFSLGAMALAVRALLRHTRIVRERAEELERFAGRVAHDIRGPLAPAMFALESLATRPADEETARRWAQRGTRSLARVKCIVDDLLAFAQSGGHPDLDAKTSLREAVSNTLAEVESFAVQHGTVVVAERIDDVSVACAAGVVGSILSNLVRNSVKFMGDRAERRVRVVATTENEHVCIEVEDTGPGIPVGLQKFVFEPYFRGPRTEANGVGLGLATVKRLVEAHGGTVTIHSSEGKGCTVRCKLPIGRDPASMPLRRRRWSRPGRGTPCRS